jgi:hypothetical protein
MASLNTKQIMKTALDDLVAQGIDSDNLFDFISTVAGTLGFVFGALHVSTEKKIPLEEIDLQIDSMSEFIKSCARRTTELTPPKAN